MTDFLPDDELARLHQLDLDAKAGVDASDDDDRMTYAEWKEMNDEARATGN
jgi:post-segregation antitoxin (ccd killing protein)